MGCRRLLDRELGADDRAYQAVGDHRPHIADGLRDDLALAARPPRGPRPQRRTDHPGALAEKLGHVQLAFDAALHADDDNSTVGCQRVDIAVEVGGAHDVEDHVGSGAVRRLAQPLHEIFFAVIDEDLRTELLAQVEFHRRSGSHRDPAVECSGDLDAMGSDAAGAAVKQHHLAGREPGGHHHVGPHRARHLGKRGGMGQLDGVWDRHQLALGHRDELGVPTS